MSIGGKSLAIAAVALGLIAVGVCEVPARADNPSNPYANIGPSIDPNRTPAGGAPYTYCAGEVLQLSDPGSCNPSLDLHLADLLAHVLSALGGLSIPIPINDLPVPPPKKK